MLNFTPSQLASIRAEIIVKLVAEKVLGDGRLHRR